MKKYFIIFISTLLFSFNLFAQTPSDSIIKGDLIMSKIIKSIPKGWTYSIDNGKLIIERNDSVFTAEKKTLNYPLTKKIPEDTIYKYGIKIKSRIIYKMEERWSTEKTMSVYSNNTKIYQKLKALPEKYNIVALYDKTLSTRGNMVYTGKTKDEIERVKKFENERTELLSKIINLPNYHTDYFSLFLLSTEGCNEDYICIAPDIASMQVYEILALIQDLAEKSKIQ